MSDPSELPEIFRDLKTIDPDKEVVYCKNCTMSNQRPRIQFNDKGFCSPCVFHEYKNKFIDWDKREKELAALCDRHRRDDGTWDVIVPSSGGKDSSYVSYILKEKYGMKPLTVTWAPSVPTDIGRDNLFNMCYAGQDNILFSPNGETHRILSKASLIELGDNFIPFAYGQINVPLQCAVRFNIPFVMYGENGDLEYGGSIQDYNRPTLKISTTTIEDKFSGLPRPSAASGLPKENWLPEGVKIEDLGLYLPPTKSQLDKLKVEEYYFSYFEYWKPEEHYEVAKQHCGYKPNSKRTEGTYTDFASLDDKLDGFHYYLMFIKQGIGRATSDSAHQVRQEIITRDEGVELVQKYDGEFPSEYLDLFLDYMQMDMDELNKVFDNYRRDIIWKKENNDWKLKQQITKL